MLKLIGIFSLIGAAMIVVSACNGDPPPSPVAEQTTATKNVMLLCSGGLDRDRRVKLGAELERRGGKLDAGYVELVRNAILAMVKDLGIPEADRADATIKIQKQYLDCVKNNAGPLLDEPNKERKRLALAQCLAGCCEAFDCEDDCPMTSYRNISFPSGKGRQCWEGTTYEWGCRTNAWGFTLCQMWPVRISYGEMRSCMRECKRSF